MAWRAMGQPEWLANTDFTSYMLFVIGAGALFHLLAPGALDEDVPPKRWIKIGAWIGAGVLLAIVFAERDDIASFIQTFHPPHDQGAVVPPDKARTAGSTPP